MQPSFGGVLRSPFDSRTSISTRMLFRRLPKTNLDLNILRHGSFQETRLRSKTAHRFSSDAGSAEKENKAKADNIQEYGALVDAWPDLVSFRISSSPFNYYIQEMRCKPYTIAASIRLAPRNFDSDAGQTAWRLSPRFFRLDRLVVFSAAPSRSRTIEITCWTRPC